MTNNEDKIKLVLILVLVEYVLRGVQQKRKTLLLFRVLILVLVEYVLRVHYCFTYKF